MKNAFSKSWRAWNPREKNLNILEMLKQHGAIKYIYTHVKINHIFKINLIKVWFTSNTMRLFQGSSWWVLTNVYTCVTTILIKIQNIYIIPEVSHDFSQSVLHSLPWRLWICFLSLYIFSALQNGIIQSWLICMWLSSLCIMFPELYFVLVLLPMYLRRTLLHPQNCPLAQICTQPQSLYCCILPPPNLTNYKSHEYLFSSWISLLGRAWAKQLTCAPHDISGVAQPGWSLPFKTAHSHGRHLVCLPAERWPWAVNQGTWASSEHGG